MSDALRGLRAFLEIDDGANDGEHVDDQYKAHGDVELGSRGILAA